MPHTKHSGSRGPGGEEGASTSASSAGTPVLSSAAPQAASNLSPSTLFALGTAPQHAMVRTSSANSSTGSAPSGAPPAVHEGPAYSSYTSRGVPLVPFGASASALASSHASQRDGLVADLPSQVVVDDLMQRLADATHWISQPKQPGQDRPVIYHPSSRESSAPGLVELGFPSATPLAATSPPTATAAPSSVAPVPAPSSPELAEATPIAISFNPLRTSPAGDPNANLRLNLNGPPQQRAAERPVPEDPSREHHRLLVAGRGNSGGNSHGATMAFGAGGNGGGGGRNNDANLDADIDEDIQSHSPRFRCGIIPTRFRREFLPPIVCVILMIVAGTIVAVLLYRSLHDAELKTFTTKLQSSCDQRAKLLQQNFDFALASCQSLAGLFSLQQKYQKAGLMISDADWQLYITQAGMPTFIGQLAFFPRVLNSERAAFEAITGHPITDWNLCANPPTCSQLTVNRPRGVYPYYFPYLYKSPGFAKPLINNVPDYYNLDAVWALPIQGIDSDAIAATIASGEFRFSNRQPLGDDLSSTSSASASAQGTWGNVAMLPFYQPTMTLSTTGVRATDFTVNLNATIGIVAAIIRANSALQSASDALDPLPLELILYDTADPTNVLFIAQVDSPLVTADNLSPQHNGTVDIIYGQRSYRLDCTPTKEYVQTGYSSTPLLIGVGAGIVVGVAIMIILCGWLVLNVRRTNQRAEMLLEANSSKNAALALLAQAKELADRANKSKSDFLAFLCHELRNPLHAIANMIDFLSQDYFATQLDKDLASGGRSSPYALGGIAIESATPTEEERKAAEKARKRERKRAAAAALLTTGGTVAGTELATTGEQHMSGHLSPDAGRRVSIGNEQQLLMPHTGSPFGDTPVAGFSGGSVTSATRSRRQRETGRAEAADCVGVIRSQVDLMRTIIDDCLDMSKIEAGVIQFECIAIELAVLARQCVQSLSGKCKDKGVRLRLRIDQTNLPRRVFADPTRLKQLILNLLTNAVKFTNKGVVQLVLAATPWSVEAAMAAELELPEETDSAAAPTVDGAPSNPDQVHITIDAATKPPTPVGASNEAHTSGDVTNEEKTATPTIEMQPIPILANGLANGSDQADGQPDAIKLLKPSRIILQVSVADSGSGIDPSALPHLFQPYSQEKLSIMRTHGGTGLGLAIVKNIVSWMRGSIQVKSEVGKGSTFTLFLPLEVRAPGALSHLGDDEAEVHSSILRLRAARAEKEQEEEEEDDAIESHLLDKFDRSEQEAIHSSDSDSGGAPISTPKLQPKPAQQWPIAPFLAAPRPPRSGSGSGGGVPRIPSPGGQLTVAGLLQREGSGTSKSRSSLSVGVPMFHDGGSSGSGSSSKTRSSPARDVLATNNVNGNGILPMRSAVDHNTGHAEGEPRAGTPVLGGRMSSQQPSSLDRAATDTTSHQSTPPNDLGCMTSMIFSPASTGSLPGIPLGQAVLAGSSAASGSSASYSAPSSGASAPRRLGAPSAQAPPTLHLLLVDDADVNLKILRKMLGSSLLFNGVQYRLDLTMACNGLEAMERVEERFAGNAPGGGPRQFSIILSDIVMPLADGFAFARLLRAFEAKHAYGPAPLLALTANALKNDVDAYKAASFKWFIPKPFRRADLQASLQIVLNETHHVTRAPPTGHEAV